MLLCTCARVLHHVDPLDHVGYHSYQKLALCHFVLFAPKGIDYYSTENGLDTGEVFRGALYTCG